MGFSVRESGVGGIFVLVPRAMEEMGGVVGSKESRKVPEGWDAWMYWAGCQYERWWGRVETVE